MNFGITCSVLQSLLDPPDRIYYEKDLPSFFFGLCRNTPEGGSVQQEGGSVQQGTPEESSVQQDTPERGCFEKLREDALCRLGYKTEKQENEDMLKFIGEKIEGKEDVYITSWSWGNYDALKVVKMALKCGKKVHWKILNVANEYLLGPEYYCGKESFLTELNNFLSEIGDKQNATGYKDRLRIDVRDQQTQDSPSTSYDSTKIIQEFLHPKRDMKELREVVDKNLLDKNSNSAKYNSVGGDESFATHPSGDMVKLREVVGHSSSNNAFTKRITTSPQCKSVDGDDGEVCNSVDGDDDGVSLATI
jgi:hypothetical protein